MRIALVVASAAAAIGCSRVVSNERAPYVPEPPDHRAVIADHMRANYDLARGGEQLLLRGDLPAAQALARMIAEVAEPTDAGFAAEAAAVRRAAADVARAPSIDEALRREAHLAAECAACHRAAGAIPDRGLAPPAPADDDSVDARMARHRWAAALLWDAAIGGSDLAWQTGLDVLAEAPLEWPGISDRAWHARRLQDLAAGARRDPVDPAARARVHGELLVVCAACHAVRDHAAEQMN